MTEFDFGKVEDVIGFDEYLNKRLAEKQKIIDEQQATIEQLRTQLLICQQSKSDGRFQVWEVPPIPQGTRITFSTTERSGKNE